MVVTLKTVKDIKTNSVKVYDTTTPYKAYMRISRIQREKIRRLSEREQAVKRIRRINRRLAGLEIEKKAIRQQRISN